MSVRTSQSTIAQLEMKKSKDFGLELLRAFHNYNKHNSNYKLSFEQLILMLEKRPNQKNFLSILGGSVLNSGTDKKKAITAMEQLGFKSKGKIPSSNANFKSAIIENATAFSYVDAIVYTATETASQVVQGVQAVGNTLIDTGKILRFLFPIAVVYFLYVFLKKKVA